MSRVDQDIFFCDNETFIWINLHLWDIRLWFVQFCYNLMGNKVVIYYLTTNIFLWHYWKFNVSVRFFKQCHNCRINVWTILAIVFFNNRGFKLFLNNLLLLKNLSPDFLLIISKHTTMYSFVPFKCISFFQNRSHTNLSIFREFGLWVMNSYVRKKFCFDTMWNHNAHVVPEWTEM